MKGDTRALSVFIRGTLAGHVLQDRNGLLSFEYVPSYTGVPLSLSMPITPLPHAQRVVRPYLMGLLPDDSNVRADIGERFGCSGENPFALLTHIGLDCPGAVQLVPEGEEQLVEDRSANLIPLTEEDVCTRLRLLRSKASSPWGSADNLEGHWSLGGAQSKMALHYERGQWYACEGSAASTHILKPGVSGYDNQALDEYICQQVARELDLPAARVHYHEFEGEPCIVIERYDRLLHEDGSVERIHQEDLCQALSVDPAHKYAEQGGPSTPGIATLLATTGKNSAPNLRAFILYLLFNYLTGATDAHAKNYSVLLGEEGFVQLAPLYDVASIAPYQSLSPRRRKPLRAAMSIGGENRFGMLGRENLERLAAYEPIHEAGVSLQWVISSAEMMAERIPPSFESVITRASEQGYSGAAEIGDVLIREISANCRRFIERL